MLIDDMDRNFDAIKDPSVSFKPLIPHDAQGQGSPHLGSSKALKPILTAFQKLIKYLSITQAMPNQSKDKNIIYQMK